MTEPNTDNPVAEFKFNFDETEVVIKLEFHVSEGAEEIMDVGSFVEMASSAVLRAVTGT